LSKCELLKYVVAKICSKKDEFELPSVCTAARTSNISIAVPIAKVIAKPRPIDISDVCVFCY
jgi:hypothetical protein